MSSSDQTRSSFSEIISGQMTPSARYGLVVLLALVGFFGIKQLYSRVGELGQEATRAASDLAVLSNDDAEKTWLERASSAEAAKAAWREHMWVAGSAGVGAAQLETALRDMASTASIDKLQINVNPDPVERGELTFLRFALSGQIPPGQAHQLIAVLATSKPGLIVTDLQLTAQQRGDMTFKIDGIAPFTTDTGGAE